MNNKSVTLTPLKHAEHELVNLLPPADPQVLANREAGVVGGPARAD